MKNTQALEKLVKTIETLRGPNGCLWDKEQTHESLKNNLIEETYEVIDAIDSKDSSKLKEELGDLLLHVIFHSNLAKEEKQFDIYDVINGITEKMVHRHPHVFGDTKVKNTEEILDRWEKTKFKEKTSRKSITDGIPNHFPALLKANKLQKKVAKVGFNWKVIDDVIKKIEEELEEVKEAHNEKYAIETIKEEIGDLLFATVNFARFLNICPEEALNTTIDKFKKRFAYIEKNIKPKYNKDIFNADLDEMENLWNEAKKYD
jgi:tetrapyrrole methylase family protein / MazG family protein